ncbi:MAG: methyltransferase FkbM family [Solirubrobacterales bacterium]|nr:methyltransferase FkbM family [Solirubrobacterales bacterium]
MLSRERVGLVQVEAGLNPENDLHVPLEALRAELEKHGYRLFGFYEQVGEWPTQGPQLRRTNAVFLARTLISASPAVPARL